VPSHAAFLRGVNLGSRRRVGGAELRALFEELGFREVSTFRTSGNVVFTAGRESREKLARRIEKSLEESLGYEVTIFLRTGREVQEIAKQRPFPRKSLDRSEGKLQVALLAAPVPARLRKDVLALETGEDRLAFGDRELYWLPAGGTRASVLDLRSIEKLVGQWTMRTKATVEELSAKRFEA
jgi:uncharacterized protein (DUF1697 family)